MHIKYKTLLRSLWREINVKNLLWRPWMSTLIATILILVKLVPRTWWLYPRLILVASFKVKLLLCSVQHVLRNRSDISECWDKWKKIRKEYLQEKKEGYFLWDLQGCNMRWNAHNLDDCSCCISGCRILRRLR